jgi:acetate kinase
MRQPILVLNAGSSSVKFSLYETALDRSLLAGAHGQIEAIGARPHFEVADAKGHRLADKTFANLDHFGAVAVIHDWLCAEIGSEANLHGLGHRIVHGGLAYTQPILIDQTVLAAIEDLVPLAPLHQPHHLAAIRTLAELAPNLRQVACFDTSFHRNQPAIAQKFALPRALTAKGILRYGFHGLSYEYIMSVIPTIAPDIADRRLIIAHLGNGVSMCAVNNGRSIASTMGFSAVDGLMMGTRTGALDPGVILYLLQHEGMQAKEIENLLYSRSGLLGVSGISSDMRILLASEAIEAKEAIDLFVYRIGRELGSLVAALDGLDGIILTAGIGEHSPIIRARICAQARWLGVELDTAANDEGRTRISSDRSSVPVYVVPTDENRMVAQHARRVLDELDARNVS